MLNTNPETVRRWIRDKKLDATIKSKKGGHIICEAALKEFLEASPKYAATTTASIAGAALLSTVMVGGLVAQKLFDNDQLKKVRVSDSDVIAFIHKEIAAREKSIKVKEGTIAQLNKEISAEKQQILEFIKPLTGLKDKEDASE